MTTLNDTPHVGDDFNLTLAVKKADGSAKDLSGVTVKKIRIRCPGIATVERDATFVTDGSDGLVRYFVPGAENTVDGKWWGQARFTMADGKVRSTSFDSFDVAENL